MLITQFRNKVIFKANENMIEAVGQLLRQYIDRLTDKRTFYRNIIFDDMYPLKAHHSYAFDASWNQPLGGLFSNWASDQNSYWIYVEGVEDLADLEALVRLNVSSYKHMLTPEVINLAKEQIAKDGLVVKELLKVE